MRIDILSLFPDYFTSPFGVSIVKRAIEKGIVDLRFVDIREFTLDKHKKVDDRPFGGGPGMVLAPQPTLDAIRSVKTDHSHVIYLSPQGRKLDVGLNRELAKKPHLILLCGHYEGIDERVLDEVDEEISIGDYVLTSGCPAAVVVVDSVVRYLPGVLGDPESAQKESLEGEGIFEGPQYTRPVVFEGKSVPDILLSGHHREIEKWRVARGEEKTKKVRPDLYEKYEKNLSR